MSADALNPGVRKREVFGWAMHDLANSGNTTAAAAAVFAACVVGWLSATVIHWAPAALRPSLDSRP